MPCTFRQRLCDCIAPETSRVSSVAPLPCGAHLASSCGHGVEYLRPEPATGACITSAPAVSLAPVERCCATPAPVIAAPAPVVECHARTPAIGYVAPVPMMSAEIAVSSCRGVRLTCSCGLCRDSACDGSPAPNSDGVQPAPPVHVVYAGGRVARLFPVPAPAVDYFTPAPTLAAAATSIMVHVALAPRRRTAPAAEFVATALSLTELRQ